MNKIILTIILTIIISLFAACNIINRETVTPPLATSSWRCNPIPSTFQESDLIGTWKAEFGGESRTDTLILEKDGTYAQLFINSNTGYRYESTLNEWWLERLSSGGTYLHLEGMLFCGGVEEKCINPKDEEEFYDYCADQWIQMNSDFILALVGDKDALRGISLRHLKPPGWDFYYIYYTLQALNQGK